MGLLFRKFAILPGVAEPETVRHDKISQAKHVQPPRFPTAAVVCPKSTFPLGLSEAPQAAE
jgi:hypothetical protein